jgi:hypothetical protein
LLRTLGKEDGAFTCRAKQVVSFISVMWSVNVL